MVSTNQQDVGLRHRIKKILLFFYFFIIMMKCEYTYDEPNHACGEYAFFGFPINLLDVANLPATLRSLFSLASVHFLFRAVLYTRSSLGFSRSFLFSCPLGVYFRELRRSSSDTTSDTSVNGHGARSPTPEKGGGNLRCGLCLGSIVIL